MDDKTCFGGKYIYRVSFRFKGQHAPICTPKNFQLKQMDSVFAYILTTDIAFNTKLNTNIKQVKYYITVYNNGTQGA